MLEDDKAHQELCLRAFREDTERFRVSVAGSIRSARDITSRDQPSLIIADWILPDGKGIDILARDGNGRVTIPLIVMTSHGDENLAVEIMKSGAIDYIVKSSSVFRELPHIVRKALRDWENIRQRVSAETDLLETQKRLGDILSFLPDAVLAIDNSGTVIAWNHALEEMTGVPAPAMLGKGNHEYSLPFYGERRPILIDLTYMADEEIEKKYDYIQREGNRITSETFIPGMRNGKGAFLWATATPLFDLQGNRTGAIEVIRDITSRKEAEQTVRKQKTTLETLLNAPHDTIALLDRQGIIQEINSEGARRLGGNTREVTGQCAYDLLPPSVAASRKTAIDQVFATGTPSIFDDERSGMFLHNEIYPVFNPEQPVVERVAIFARDITEQKRFEIALLESETRFRRISGLISDFAYSCTRTGSEAYLLDWISGDIRNVTGYSDEEVLAMGCWRGIVMEEDLPVFDQQIAGLVPGTSSRCEIRIRCRDKTVRWLRCFAECVHEQGKPGLHRLLGGCIDITEQKETGEALEKAREWLGIALRAARAGTWDWDFSAGRLTWSAEFFELFGLPLQTPATFETWLATLHPEDRGPAMARIEQSVKDRIPLWNEYRIVLPDSSVRWIGAAGNTTYNEAGEPVRMSGVCIDITDRKNTEEKLRESEGRLRLFIDHAPAALAMLDREMRYIAASRRWLTDYHIDNEDLIGRSHYEVFPELTDAIRDVHRRSLAGEVIRADEDRFTRADGSVVWLRWEVRPWHAPDGFVGGIVIFSEDITARKVTQDQLRESEERFSKAFHANAVGQIISRKQDGTILDANEAYSTITGYPREELLGRSTLSLNLWYDPADRDALIRELDENGHARNRNVKARTRDGGMRTLLVSMEPVELRGERCLISFALDITDSERAEAARSAYAARLDAAMEIGSLAWWEMDLPEGTIRFDDRKAGMLGYSPEKFHHYADFTALLHPDDFAPAMEAMQNHLDGRDSRYHMDYRIRAVNGDYRWFRDVGGITRRHPDGSPATVTGIVVDISTIKAVEERLLLQSQILETLNEGVSLVRTSDGCIMYSNPRFNIMFGYAPMDLDGKPISVINAPYQDRSPEDIAGDIARHLRQDGFWSGEVLNRRKDGTTLWCRALVSSFTHPQYGEVWISSNEDISDKKAAENALHESEQKFRTIADYTHDWEYWILPDGKYQYVSPACERITGYLPEDFYKDPDLLQKIIHPDDRLKMSAHSRQVVIDTDSEENIEFRIVRKDGSPAWIGHICHPITSADGRYLGRRGSNRDITRRRRMEEALHESEERLRLALEGAGAAFWDWDLKTGKAFFSDRFYTMLGYEPGEFPATYTAWSALIHPEDRIRVLPDLDRQIREKQPYCEIEYRCMSKDGSWIWILGRGRIVDFDENGVPSRLTGVNIDITNRRLMESEIRSLNAVLEQRVRDRTEALQKANEALEEENAQRVEAEKKLQATVDEKSMLLKEIHHRVKNNLQIIASLLNLQSRYIRDEQTLAAIRESQNRVKAMALVHEKLYRSEDIAHITLDDYIRFLGTGLFQFYDARSRGIQFRLEIHDISVDINAAIPLGLIINELLSNSLKYAFPEGRRGEIAIAITKDGHTLHVQFRDTGIGIPETIDWKNTQSLGLRLVNTLVDQMNGTIDLDRTNGTRFLMELHEKS